LVVLLGDSYISGEGGRWAGNTSGRPGPVDALGRDAYDDGDGPGDRAGCHRARGLDVPVDGWRTMNLACSGAQTRSLGSGTTFTPGLDFRQGPSAGPDPAGQAAALAGQAAALRDFASDATVAAVVVSIGGNDVGFGSLVGGCAVAFVGSSAPCRTDSATRSGLSPAALARTRDDVGRALGNVAEAMEEAGYEPHEWRLVVQTYPSPLPPAGRVRYRETLLERGLLGGCPFYDADLTWAGRVVVPAINAAVRGAVVDVAMPNVEVADMAGLLAGHRLCERGVGQLEPTTSWRDDGAADTVEWVNRVYTGERPWQVQESLHPNYWGVLAMRACVARVLDGAETC
jgi:hypothetical protein